MTAREKNYYLAQPVEALQDQISPNPNGPRGEADDIAYGVLYLASDEAKFVIGAELVIDGGLSASS